MTEEKNIRAALEGQQREASDKIFTIPNVISFVRLCMAPVFLVLLFNDNNIAAAVLFAIAAGTDFVDGQIARRTNSVSKLGQLLDPAVDRILMICAVVGLMVVKRLPVWIVAVVIIRDLALFAGQAFLLKKYNVRVAVVYAGKFATTFLFVGLAGLLLNLPLVPGLGVCDFGWLPGFNDAAASWGIWCVYIGLVIGACTTVYYVVRGAQGFLAARKSEA